MRGAAELVSTRGEGHEVRSPGQGVSGRGGSGWRAHRLSGSPGSGGVGGPGGLCAVRRDRCRRAGFADASLQLAWPWRGSDRRLPEQPVRAWPSQAISGRPALPWHAWPAWPRANDRHPPTQVLYANTHSRHQRVNAPRATQRPSSCCARPGHPLRNALPAACDCPARSLPVAALLP